MAKKKSISANFIVSNYMDYVLRHNSKPQSVYRFATDTNFDESLFYNHFASFEALENSIFGQFFTNTIQVLEKSEDYKSYDSRNKLLSFYFTFFEILKANRSYVVFALPQNTDMMKGLKSLSLLRESFKNYIEELDIDTIDLKQEFLEFPFRVSLHTK